jgi:transcriptional regulator of acetoin/glycerol metabolism
MLFAGVVRPFCRESSRQLAWCSRYAKPGLIERAQGGTRFLDEVGDMPFSAQSKLLRFLEDRQLISLSTTHGQTLNLRVVAATGRAITCQTHASGVRLDLADRLGPEPLVVPPLILSEDHDAIQIIDLPMEHAPTVEESAAKPACDPRERPSFGELSSLLVRYQGNVGGVARAIGRQRTLVLRWIRKAGLNPAAYRDQG